MQFMIVSLQIICYYHCHFFIINVDKMNKRQCWSVFSACFLDQYIICMCKQYFINISPFHRKSWNMCYQAFFDFLNIDLSVYCIFVLSEYYGCLFLEYMVVHFCVARWKKRRCYVFNVLSVINIYYHFCICMPS